MDLNFCGTKLSRFSVFLILIFADASSLKVAVLYSVRTTDSFSLPHLIAGT